MIALLLAATALAADWPLIQGTEVGRPDVAASLGGFLQVDADAYVFDPPITGVEGKEGVRPSFDGTTDTSLWIRRARAIGRGSLPGTDQKVNWLLAAELGQNGLTRAAPVALTDASVTLSYVPYARLRVGQFKLPIMEEALQTQPVAGELVDYSDPVRLLVEDRVVGGAYAGGTYGFRDLGAQVFDTVRAGPVAVSYALMASNGRPGALEADEHRDVTGRVQVAYVLDDPAKPSSATSPRRPEVSFSAWRQQGQRVQDGVTGVRMREGVDANVERGPLRAGTGWVVADGMIEQGAAFPGDPVTVDVDGHAWGGMAFARWDFGKVAVAARWSGLWTFGATPADERVLQTVTPALRVEPVDKVHVSVNYERRTAAAPHGADGTKKVLATMGDHVIAEVGIVF